MDNLHLFLVTFHLDDERDFFNAVLRLGHRRPRGISLRHWFMSENGRVSYSIWEAAEKHALMGILDVEFGNVAEYDIEEVHILWGY